MKNLTSAQVRRLMLAARTPEEWEQELARLSKRLERIRAAMRGSADVTRVRVGRAKVRAHERAAHTRLVITLRK